jgi:hypothetical protein
MNYDTDKVSAVEIIEALERSDGAMTTEVTTKNVVLQISNEP